MVQSAVTRKRRRIPRAREIRTGQHLVGARPDHWSRTFIQQFFDSEIPLEFEMGPMVERVAQRVRHGTCPGQELVVRSRGAGAEWLLDSVGPHGPPLVMIAFEPDLKQIREAAVHGDPARRKMVVIVQNRLRLGVVEVQPTGSLGAQKKVFVKKSHRGLVGVLFGAKFLQEKCVDVSP